MPHQGWVSGSRVQPAKCRIDNRFHEVVQYYSDGLVFEYTSTETPAHVEQSIVPVSSTAQQYAAVRDEESESGSHGDYQAQAIVQPRTTPVSSPARASLGKQISTQVTSPRTMVLDYIAARSRPHQCLQSLIFSTTLFLSKNCKRMPPSVATSLSLAYTISTVNYSRLSSSVVWDDLKRLPMV